MIKLTRRKDVNRPDSSTGSNFVGQQVHAMVSERQESIVVRFHLVTVHHQQRQTPSVPLDRRGIIFGVLQQPFQKPGRLHLEQRMVSRDHRGAKSALHQLTLPSHLVAISRKCDHVLTPTPKRVPRRVSERWKVIEWRLQFTTHDEVGLIGIYRPAFVQEVGASLGSIQENKPLPKYMKIDDFAYTQGVRSIERKAKGAHNSP